MNKSITLFALFFVFIVSSIKAQETDTTQVDTLSASSMTDTLIIPIEAQEKFNAGIQAYNKKDSTLKALTLMRLRNSPRRQAFRLLLVVGSLLKKISLI